MVKVIQKEGKELYQCEELELTDNALLVATSVCIANTKTTVRENQRCCANLTYALPGRGSKI